MSNPGIGVQAEALMSSHQVTCLWVVFGLSVHKISWSCEVRLPPHAEWSELFSAGSNCVVLQLQVCLVCSFPSRVGFSVLNAALCPRDRLLDSPPALLWEVSFLLSLYVSPDICWVPVATLGSWFVSPLLLSAFAFYGTSLRVQHWKLNSLPHPWQLGSERSALCPSLILHGGFSIPSLFPMSLFDYSLLFMAFSFAGGGVSVHPGAVLDYIPRVGGWVGQPQEVHDAHLYVLQFHAGSLEPTVMVSFRVM
jgi:hypothetical protein